MEAAEDERLSRAAAEIMESATRKQVEEEKESTVLSASSISSSPSTSSPPSSHRRATPEQIAALSPSPFPSASDDLAWEDVTSADGGVLQFVLEAGEGAVIQPLNRVYMLARACTGSPTATPFLDRLADDELDFILGQAQQPKGLEIALCSLRVGCQVLLRIRGSDYGYSNTRRPAAVEANDGLHFELRVVRQEKEKNLHQMTVDEKLQYCRLRREVGKALFQQGQVRSAYKQYEKARSVLQSMDGREGEGGDEKDELETMMRVNAAACMMRVGDFIAVVELCNGVITKHPTHPKALYRRAAARMAREEWTDAAADLTTLLASTSDSSMDGATREQVQKQLVRCKQRLKKAEEGSWKRLDGFLLSERRPALYDDQIRQREAEVEQERRQSHALWSVVDMVKDWLDTAVSACSWAWQAGWRRCRRHSD